MRRFVLVGALLGLVLLCGLPTFRMYTLWKLQSLFRFGKTSIDRDELVIDSLKLVLPQEIPESFSEAWAWALLKTEREETQTNAFLIRLLQKFPQRPEVYASLLRNQMRRFRLGREEESRFGRSPAPVRPADPKVAQQVLEWAQRGEALDPENAFFTGMRVRALLALRRDKEALAALQQAAQKTRWDDYTAEEAEARIAYWKQLHGMTSGEVDIVISTIILFPHLATERALARVFVAKAWDLEQQGRYRESLPIRVALAGYAQKMINRESVLRTLIGIAIVHLAASTPPDNSSATAEQRQIRFLQRIEKMGFVEEARYFRAELARVETIRERIRHGTNAFFDQQVIPTMRAYYIQLLVVFLLQGLVLLLVLQAVFLWIAQRARLETLWVIVGMLIIWLLTATWFALSQSGLRMGVMIFALRTIEEILSSPPAWLNHVPLAGLRWGLPIGSFMLWLAFLSVAIVWALAKHTESPEQISRSLRDRFVSLAAWVLLALVLLLGINWRTDRQMEAIAREMRENEVGLVLGAQGLEPTLPPPTKLPAP